MRRLLFSVIVIFNLSGCASLVVPDVTDSDKLEKEHGIMVTNIVTNYSDYSVTIINKNNLTIASAIFKVKAGENFRVISLPAGEYSWRGIYIRSLHSEFRDKMDFTVKPQEINYIGDLLINIDLSSQKYRMGVRDNSEVAKKRVKEGYPELSRTYPFSTELTVDKRSAGAQR